MWSWCVNYKCLGASDLLWNFCQTYQTLNFKVLDIAEIQSELNQILAEQKSRFPSRYKPAVHRGVDVALRGKKKTDQRILYDSSYASILSPFAAILE